MKRCAWLTLMCAWSLTLFAQTPAAKPSSSGPANGTLGTVIFSRHDAPLDAPTSAPATPSGAKPKNSAPANQASKDEPVTVTDAERTSLTFLAYDCEVHLVPSEHSLSMRAQITIRNDGQKPLQRLALQISSSLSWYSIHANGKSLPFVAHMMDSDIDHTGKLDEAVITLPQPLAAGASLSLDVLYSGTVGQSAERILRIGAPANVALTSDWDRIAPEFTGLRGFGNVIWFPVSTPPVLLGQGAQLFNAIGQWKLRQSDARIHLHVLVEYTQQAPTVAILNGNVVLPDAPQPGSQAPMTTPGVLRVASFTLQSARVGFHPLGLFVLSRNAIAAQGITIYARAEHAADAANYQQAAELVRPTVEQWLGTQQKRPVILVDLPESDDLPYEDRNILYLPLAQDTPKDLTPLLAHMSSHAYFLSPRIWLDEGVAQFITTLWTEHVAGRDTAIEQLDSRRAALSLAEPAHPGTGADADAGQSLIGAYSDIYYRDKAAFVFWMLRNLVGDDALGNALRNYDLAQDREPSYLQHRLEQASHKDTEWFFDDWVYRDRGLPDLKITGVHSRPLLHGTTKNYLVAVDIANDSDCATQVPVEVQAGASNQNSSLQVPAQNQATVRILLPNPPDTVIVNDGTVPEVTASTHRQAVQDQPAAP